MVADLRAYGVSCGRWQTNVWLIADAQGTAIIIDPGEGARPIVEAALDEHDLTPQAIVCTHGHIDHTWDAGPLARSLALPVYLGRDDVFLWRQPGQTFGVDNLLALRAALGVDWEATIADVEPLDMPDTLDVGSLTLRASHTPGHTPGHHTLNAGSQRPLHVAWSLGSAAAGERPDAAVMVSGDLLFAGSIGRSDFPEGDPEAMDRSLRAELAGSDDGLVLPGHGEITTIATERQSNPFLARLGL